MNRPGLYKQIARELVLQKDLKHFRGLTNAAQSVKEIIQMYEEIMGKQIILDGLCKKQKRYEHIYPDSVFESDNILVKTHL